MNIAGFVYRYSISNIAGIGSRDLSCTEALGSRALQEDDQGPAQEAVEQWGFDHLFQQAGKEGCVGGLGVRVYTSCTSIISHNWDQT